MEELDTATAIAQLTSLIGQRKIELAFLEMSLATLNQTYQVKLKELDKAKETIANLEAQLIQVNPE